MQNPDRGKLLRDLMQRVRPRPPHGEQDALDPLIVDEAELQRADLLDPWDGVEFDSLYPVLVTDEYTESQYRRLKLIDRFGRFYDAVRRHWWKFPVAFVATRALVLVRRKRAR